MSRRVPLSRASEVVSALRECHGRIAWADMPPTLRSDDQAAYDATALGLAELGLAGRPAGDADRAALLRDWRTLVPQDCIQSSKSRQFALSISHTSLGACPHP